MTQSRYSICITLDATEMPRCFSISIQSLVAWRVALRAFTEPAIWIAPENSSSFSVSVVLPASGWEMMAKVRRRRVSAARDEADKNELRCRPTDGLTATSRNPLLCREGVTCRMAKLKDEERLQVAGREIVVTHPGKLLFPEAGVTKL